MAAKALADGAKTLLCADEILAFGALAAAKATGKNIGTELLVACCNNSPTTKFVEPPLTAVEIFPEQLGAAAGEKICALIAGKTVAAMTYVPTQIIERESTGGSSQNEKLNVGTRDASEALASGRDNGSESLAGLAPRVAAPPPENSLRRR
jgi:hypothetical protein